MEEEELCKLLSLSHFLFLTKTPSLSLLLFEYMRFLVIDSFITSKERLTFDPFLL